MKYTSMNFVKYIYRMRIAAIVFIVLAVIANFIFDNLTIFVLAMFSFPALLWVLLKKKKQRVDKQSAIKINDRMDLHTKL